MSGARSSYPDARIDPNTGKPWILCLGCECPMLPPGVEKKPGEYDHAQHCPEPTIEKLHLPSRIRRGRASTDATWKVVRWRGADIRFFGRKKDAVDFAIHGCLRHTGPWCTICRGRAKP